MTEINLCNEVLKNAIGVHRSLEKIEPLNPMDAVAVQAMEELLKYRAIGTVEGYKRALEISKENFRVSMEYKAKVQAFEAIGTIEEFKALKEKSVAKKAILSRKHHEAYCPNCHFVISDGEFYLLDEYVHYCEDCGQAVKGTDWE